MALTRTTTELATAVLRELSQIDATEDADDHTEAKTVITDAYHDKYHELRVKEMVYWAQEGIPVEIFLPIRDLIINEVSGAFGQPMPPEVREANEQIILKKIRRVTTVKHSKNRTKALYF